MMPSKQQDVPTSNISPVLFMSTDGEPMTFFLRPGSMKRELQPLITAGGGMMCKVQQPGAILLIEPEEKGSITDAAAHWYVSTKYIQDCIEKDEQLNLEDYRFHPDGAQKASPKVSSKKDSIGRVAYTAEDDAAILSYVKKHKTEIGGNRLWQKMEKQRVTCHSWQSMKYRYRAQLSKKQSEMVEEETAEEEAEAAEGEMKVEENQEADAEKASSAEDVAAPPPATHSAESDLTQIESQSLLSGGANPEIVEAGTSVVTDGEEMKQATAQIEDQPAGSTQTETEAEAVEDCSDSQKDFHLYLTPSMEPGEKLPDEIFSSHKESAPEDSPAAHNQSPHNASTKKKSREKERASPEPELLQRRVTRRQLQLGESPGPVPYGKKLRSSSSASSSPQPGRKTKLSAKSAPPKDTTDQPPSKRARGKSAAAEPEMQQESEMQQEDSGPPTISETPLTAETESIPIPKGGEKKTEKTKLGILEAASKEFEDDTESDGDEAADLQSQTEKEVQPTPKETAADADSTRSSPEPGPSLQVVLPVTQTQTSGSNCPPESVDPQPGAAEPAATEAITETCKPHLFIFERESQEEDSQSLVGDCMAPQTDMQSAGSKDAAFSLTQDQLEEDKQRIRELMKQTNQDLASVTKALLKTSGDISAAQDLLLNPSGSSRPFWCRSDDTLLHSGDPAARQELQEKYSEEALAKRIVFLEVER